MKKLFAILFAFVIPTIAFAGVEGVYRTEANENGHTANVKIAPCGNALCGVIVSSTSGNAEAIGLKIVWDMVPTGDNTWGNGKIKDPTNNKVYNSKMELQGSTLKVSGCVLGICRAQNWQRVN